MKSAAIFLSLAVTLYAAESPPSGKSGGNTPKKATINLQIADGQGGDLLHGKEDSGFENATPEEELSPGAFTVANKNDTDGDSKIDNDPTEVNVPGECDLMMMVINPPNPCSPDDWVGLVAPPNAVLWDSPTKGTRILGPYVWKASVLSPPKTVWVELLEPSSSVRAEKFTLTGGGASDSVTATGVWAQGSLLAPQPAVTWADLDEQRLLNGVQQLGLGVQIFDQNRIHPFEPTWQGIQSGILFEFQVFPSGVGAEGKVVFDLCRQGESVGASLPDGVMPWVQKQNPLTWPQQADMPNDDPGNGDEDNKPLNDHIYSVDWPGAIGLDPALKTEACARGNFSEYVRVCVGRTPFRPSANIDKNAGIVDPDKMGSRASSKEKWYFKTWWIMTSQGIQFKPEKNNIIVRGMHDPLANP